MNFRSRMPTCSSAQTLGSSETTPSSGPRSSIAPSSRFPIRGTRDRKFSEKTTTKSIGFPCCKIPREAFQTAVDALWEMWDIVCFEFGSPAHSTNRTKLILNYWIPITAPLLSRNWYICTDIWWRASIMTFGGYWEYFCELDIKLTPNELKKIKNGQKIARELWNCS